MTHACPICATKTDRQVVDTPYFECGGCLLWFQYPPPAKIYQAPNEYDLVEMPERDQEINRSLADSLFARFVKEDHAHTLDIGAKHPVLASRLAELGCIAYAIDGVMPSPMPGVICREEDFERMRIQVRRDKYKLITMIHVFEHMYDPIAAMGKLRLLVEDDGRVFLRIPDHNVKGFQRDLTPHHFSIHPYFHCMSSILELLAQRGNAFVVESTSAFEGHGQRDIVLRPITKRPTIACAMIVKNEERDLPRALKSLEPFIDHFAIADTGSTDKTMEVASEHVHVPAAIITYLGASERDEHNQWRLWDFSAARNYALQAAETFCDDWIFWADADDEIRTPDAIRRAIYWDQYDLFECWMDQGGPKWVHARLWRASKHVRFAGRVHEYPVIDGLRVCNIAESVIFHHGAPADGQENSNPRNLRILLREWEEAPTPRCCFYIADTHNHGGRKDAAVEWYARRIAMVQGYDHERAFAMLYRSRCLRELGRHDEADEQTRAALVDHPDWAEFRMELAQGFYQRGRYADAIEECVKVETSGPIPPSPLWRDHHMYRDQPARLISWCHEHLGDIAQAVEASKLAAYLIGGPDEDWAVRHRRLVAMDAARDTPAPMIVKRLREQVALVRPGAIGDILMTLNLIPAFKAANPDADVHYFCAGGVNGLGSPDALGGIMVQAGVDAIMDSASINEWAKGYDRVIQLVGYPLAEGYPEKPMARHLIRYFADEMGIVNRLIGPDDNWHGLPALTLLRPARPSQAPVPTDPYITFQNKAGWSEYKEWSADRWADTVAALKRAIDAPVYQIDERQKLTLAQSIAMFANARIHLGIDSFTNHLSNYFWTDQHGGRKVRSVILWGSTQASASGYDSNINISKGLICQPCFRENPAISRMPRGVCVNPPVAKRVSMHGGMCLPENYYDEPRTYGDGLHKCMQDISVDEVVAAALRLWEETK